MERCADRSIQSAEEARREGVAYALKMPSAFLGHLDRAIASIPISRLIWSQTSLIPRSRHLVRMSRASFRKVRFHSGSRRAVSQTRTINGKP